MKLLLDTNIFLDVLFKREFYKEAVQILNAIEEGLFEAAVLDITLLNIDYVAKKQHANIREFLTAINRHCTVVGADNQDFTDALRIKNADLEDNVHYVVAQKSGVDVIVTNDQSFYSEHIDVLRSVEFVETYL